MGTPGEFFNMFGAGTATAAEQRQAMAFMQRPEGLGKGCGIFGFQGFQTIQLIRIAGRGVGQQADHPLAEPRRGHGLAAQGGCSDTGMYAVHAIG